MKKDGKAEPLRTGCGGSRRRRPKAARGIPSDPHDPAAVPDPVRLGRCLGRSCDYPGKVTVQPLNLEINELTTLPERRGPYTIAATMPDGSTFRWRGEVSLHPVWSEGTLSFEKIRVATVWQFIRDQLLVKKPEGSFDLELRYRFALAKEQPTST